MSQHSHVKRKEDNAVVICEGHRMQRLLTVKTKTSYRRNEILKIIIIHFIYRRLSEHSRSPHKTK